jgi:hypothetical protein
MRGSRPIEQPNSQLSKHNTNSLFALSLPTTCCSSLDPTTKDGALGSPAGLEQPGDILAPTESLPSKSFDGSFPSLPGN